MKPKQLLNTDIGFQDALIMLGCPQNDFVDDFLNRYVPGSLKSVLVSFQYYSVLYWFYVRSPYNRNRDMWVIEDFLNFLNKHFETNYIVDKVHCTIKLEKKNESNT